MAAAAFNVELLLVACRTGLVCMVCSIKLALSSRFPNALEPVLARDFQPLENRHFVSVLRYLIQFLSLCSFVDCGFRVRVSVSFIFYCIFFISHVS